MKQQDKDRPYLPSHNRASRYPARWLCTVTALLGGATAGTALAQDSNRSALERADDRVDTTERAMEAYVSNDVLQVVYIRELEIDRFGPVEARGGVFYNEQRDLIGSVDLLADIGDQAPDQRRIRVNVGTRVYGAFLNTENEDTFAVSLGGEAQYFFTQDQRMSVKLGAFYAPDILTFGIADRIEDVGLRFQMRVRQGTDIFAGYRSLEIRTEFGNREVEDGAQIGFRRTF
jgi:hypothetical protein